MYNKVKITTGGYDTKVDIMPLELHDFDVILKMN